MTQRVAIGIAAAALAVGGAGVGAAQDGTLGGLMGAMDTAQTLEGADVRRARDAKAAAAAAVNEPQRDSASGAAQGAASAEATRPSTAADAGSAPVDGQAAGAGATVVATYEPGKHRDPFRPPNLGTAEAARTPLERVQIGQLKLVGVVWDAGAPRAMVEDSSGLGYIVTAGTAIGSSGGVVRRIEPRRVLIEETVTNFYGEKEPKQVVMALPEEDRSP
jgi:type IV pilus assembly protein PilP